MPTRPQRSPHLLLPLRLSPSHLPSPSSIFKSSLLMLRLRHNSRHHQPIPLPIHRHKRQISRRNMPQPLLSHILHHHPNPYLHGRPKRPIDTSLQNQQLSHSHRSHKIQMIHTRGHRKRPSMPRSRHSPHQIDVLHQPPAKQTANRIRVRRQHNLTPLRLRLRHRPFRNLITHHSSLNPSPSPHRTCAFSRSEGLLEALAVTCSKIHVIRANPC
jgi:hypothetical protein